jgi:signal transduction histidine kinase
VTPAEQSVGIVKVSALLNDVRHALRHHASLNELRVTVAPADAGLCVAGDVELLRLALVDLMLTAIDATAAGGEIMVTPEANGSTMRLRIAAHAARAPADALRTADGILVSPRAQWVCYVAARRIIETHGGSAALHADAGDMLVMDVRMPLARA